jgi:probable HAF family extracellular repeat protein
VLLLGRQDQHDRDDAGSRIGTSSRTRPLYHARVPANRTLALTTSLLAALLLLARTASAWVCDSPAGGTNIAATGTATASSNPAGAGNAIDGSASTSWSAQPETTSAVFTWEAPADVVVGQVQLPTYASPNTPTYGSVFFELLDAADAVIASGNLTVLEQDIGFGIIVNTPLFDAGSRTLRKIRLTIGSTGSPPQLSLSEVYVWSPNPTLPPTLPGPGPEELSAGASFQGVGDGAGGAFSSRANGVSPDGRLVVGETETAPGRLEAFRFADGTLAPLGKSGSILTTSLELFAPTCVAANESHAFAAANSGHVVGNVCLGTACAVARFGGGAAPEVYEPVVSALTFSNGSYASDITADGAEVTGMYNTQDASLPQWAVDSLYRLVVPQFTVLGAYGIGGAVLTQPRSSPEGDCIVATVNQGSGLPDETTSFGSCGTLPTETAMDVSAGGAHVVGSIGGLAARGIEVLGDLPGGAAASRALGVSDDGDTVVGWGTTGAGQEAFVWTAEAGMERLADRLASEGLDLTGWTLVDARGVSASGRTIVGWGTNPTGQTEGFVATLAQDGGPPPVPTASGLARGLLAAALLAAAAAARPRSRASR